MAGAASAQAAFAAALATGARNPPPGLAGPSERRFAVYRNNVAVGLIGALEARFPAVLDLVGQDFFHGLARAFLAKHPPDSPLMMCLGDRLPGFLETFAPAESLPYLADVARLEVARTRAYHAADTRRLEPSAFAAFADLPVAQVARCRMVLHPAVAVIASAHPVLTVFEMATGRIPPGEIADWRGEDVLVDRPDLDVTLARLAEGQAAFLIALQAGRTLAEAAEAAPPGFDLAAGLALIIGGGLACRLILPEEDSHDL